MTDNRGDSSSSDDLERALADMLRRRADSIDHGAIISLTDVPAAPQRWTRRRGPVLVSAAAAVVIALSALGAIVFDHRNQTKPNAARPSACFTPATVPGPGGSSASPIVPHPSCSESSPLPTSTPSPPRKTAVGPTACMISPTALRSALSAGKVSVNEPVNVGVGVGPDGTFLMDQNAYTASGTQNHAELALFGRQHGQTVWLAANPAQNVADVDPNSAVSKDWVVYAVRDTAQGPDATIYAWRRSTGQTATVRTLSVAERHAVDLNLSPPIVIGNVAYWIEDNVAGSGQQRIVGRDLTTGRTVLRIDTHSIDRLLDVGGALSWVSSASDGSKSLLTGGSAAVEVALPTSAAGPASWITSDGSTVRWQTGTGSSTRVNSATVAFDHGRVVALRPGATLALGPRYENWESNAGPLFTLPGPSVSIGTNGDVVVDTQTGRAMTWPPGTHVDLVSGDSVIVHIDGSPSGSSAPGPSSVSRISLAALRALPCT